MHTDMRSVEQRVYSNIAMDTTGMEREFCYDSHADHRSEPG